MIRMTFHVNRRETPPKDWIITAHVELPGPGVESVEIWRNRKQPTEADFRIATFAAQRAALLMKLAVQDCVNDIRISSPQRVAGLRVKESKK